MAKAHFKYWLLGMSLVMLGACYKDQGNYKYEQINEVQFEGIADAYTGYLGERINIKPKLTFTQDNGNDTARYAYEWTGLRTDAVLPADVRTEIATTRNLDLVVAFSPGPYRIYYRVTDKITGVQWQKTFSLTILSKVYEGWMLMNDVHGKTRIDMLTKTDTGYRILTDVLSSMNANVPDRYLSAKPLFMNCYPYDPRLYGIYICTAGGTTKIHPESFKYDVTYDIKYEFTNSVNSDFTADNMTNLFFQMAWLHGTNNNVYFYDRTWSTRYSEPINKMKGDVKPFKASKYMYGNSVSASALFYDDDNRRFVRHINKESSCSPLPPGELFDFNNTGKDLVYMDYSTYNNGNVFAILKDPITGKYWLARFTFDDKINQVYYGEIPVNTATDIDKAEGFAISPEFGYVMYYAGSKLYSYDFNNRSSKLMLDYGTQKVSCIKFHKFLYSSRVSQYYADNAKRLIVCSYSGSDPATSGSMRFYNVLPVQQPFQLVKEYNGLGKIVSLSYRERP